MSNRPADSEPKPGQVDEDFLPEGLSSAGGIASVSGASPAAIGVSPLLFEPRRSTPLESPETEGFIPPAVLWPLRDRKHSLGSHPDRGPVVARLGKGNGVLFVIDDGKYHCMIGRLVGHSPDGCTYSLVGRISLNDYDRIDGGQIQTEDAFSHARDIALCGVYRGDQAVSNVIVFERYRKAEDLPEAYLPSSPFIEFKGT